MKILHVITGLQRGGAETMLAKLVGGMVPRHENHVVALTAGGSVREEIERAGVPVHSLGLARGQVAPLALQRLRRLILTLGPDVIQGWMYHANLAATLATVAVWHRPPVVWNIRQTLPGTEEESRLTRLVVTTGAWLSGLPAAILYNSSAARQQHEGIGYASRRALCIGNGFDTERFRPDGDRRAAMRSALGIAAPAPVIGLVARYHPMKDHGSFLAAAARVLEEFPAAVFVMAGAGIAENNEELSRLVGHHLPPSAVRLLGERGDIENILPGLDVLALSSSRNEAFPNVLGEAMACGLPCVATAVGDSAAIVGSCGAIVAPKDSTALATALRSMLRMPADERHALGLRARRRIVGSYSLPAIADAYISLYDRLRHGN